MNTEEQERDKQRLRRRIEQEGLSGVLNNTKWQRLLDALEPLQQYLDFHRKDIEDAATLLANLSPNDAVAQYLIPGGQEVPGVTE
jgi:hypothetical protein